MSKNYSLNNIKFYERACELFGNEDQTIIAELVGVSQSKISNILKFRCKPQEYINKEPKAETVVKVAKAYNVSTDYLLGLSDNKTTDRATKELCNTLGLSEETIDILSANPNSILANEFRTKVNKEDYCFDDEKFNEELIEDDTMMIAEACSYEASKVINWLINDFINAKLVAINDCSDYWTESSLIELFYSFIESLDTSEDFSVSDVSIESLDTSEDSSVSDISKDSTKIANKFSLELSSLLVHKKGGDYFWVRQNVKELLINSAIGEINTRLHNIKHEKLLEEGE